MYSINPKLHHYKNEKGQHLIIMQVIVDRIKITVKSNFKVAADQFKNGKIIRHELAEKYNFNLKKQQLEIEHKLLNALKHQPTFNKRELDAIIKGKTITGHVFTDFAYSLIDELKHKLSAGRLRRYQTVINKVLHFDGKVTLQQINSAWLQKFENYLRNTNIISSTIMSNVKIIKTLVKQAKLKGFIDNYNFDGYKNLKIQYQEPEFLTEDEIAAFATACDDINERTAKIAGYYFLLSCYTGLRLGDALNFNAKTMVKNDEVVLYAQKNNKRSGLPLFPALRNVIDFITVNKNSFSQQTIRDGAKKVAFAAGIKKHIKFHTSRHTFCSRMLLLGFTIPEVADMAGDTIETISKTYAHVDREALRKKVLERLG